MGKARDPRYKWATVQEANLWTTTRSEYVSMKTRVISWVASGKYGGFGICHRALGTSGYPPARDVDDEFEQPWNSGERANELPEHP